MPGVEIDRRRVLACAALMAAAAATGATAADLTLEQTPTIEAPGIHGDGADAVVADHGFVLRLGERRMIGDAVRWDRESNDVYARGGLIYAMPGIRLAADRIGLHLATDAGEAWHVEASIETPNGIMPVTAAHVRFDRREAVFDDVVVGPRAGGILGFDARRLRVYLRAHPDRTRIRVARNVEGLAFTQATVRVIGVPVLWLPYAYRDFVIDYPWTSFHFGHSGRLGDYARLWAGTSLPPVWGVHLTVAGRVDHYSTAGDGYGAKALWRQDTLGRGQFQWFGMRKESVIDENSDRRERRDADAFDAEHKAALPGGALYARYVKVPPQDPPTPGAAGPTSIDRFRADYLRDDLEHRPFARRGAAGAFGVAAGTVVLDTERQQDPGVIGLDRLWGAQAVVPEIDLVGPLHLDADGWLEDLRSVPTDDQAVRGSGRIELRAMRWFAGIGLDADAGARALGYADREVAGEDVDDDLATLVPFAGAGVRVRFTSRWGEALWNDLIPRVGVEYYDRAVGDDIAVVGPFGDSRDQLVVDRRYWTAGLDTALRGYRELVRIEGVARFALRDDDRIAYDAAGGIHQSSGSFAEAEFVASASPHARVRVSGAGLYDARLKAWQSFDVSAAWSVHRRLTLTDDATLLPTDGQRFEVWQESPGAILHGNRYDLGGSLSFKSDGAAVDRWKLELTRHLVDGTLALTYEVVRDADGHIYDQRTAVSFGLR